MQKILVQLPISEPSSAEYPTLLKWCLLDGSLDRTVLSGCWSEFVDWYQADYSQVKVSACLMASDVLLTEVAAPSSNKRQLQRALPFLIEEDVAASIESVHVAAGKMIGNKVTVAVVNATLVEYWIELFKQEAISLSGLFSLADLLNVDKNELLLVECVDSILIKSASFCTQCEVANLPVYYQALSLDGIESVKFIATSGSSPLYQLSSQEKLQYSADESVEIFQETYSGEVFDLFSMDTLSSFSPAINLLQGDYTAELEVGYWQRFAKPLVLAACVWGFAQLMVYFTSGFYFDHRADKITHNLVAKYNEFFPSENVDETNYRSKLELQLRGVGRIGGRSDFSKLFALAANGILDLNKKSATTTTINSSAVEIQEFRYQEKSGELKLEVYAEAINQLDSLSQILSEKGLSVKVVSANEEDSHIKATLLIALLS